MACRRGYDSAMEIIGESAHRMLAYVEAVNRQNHPLTEGEFVAYADGWDQKVTVSGGATTLAATYASLQSAATFALWGSGRREVEPLLSYLVRLKWMVTDGSHVDITKLGKAVLREANSPLPASDVGSTLEVIIDPDNPFAYAQLMARIGSFDACMVVDPYLEQDQLLTLATFPSVRRILTSNNNSKRKAPAFAVVLSSAPHLELRMVEQKVLHDRIVMPSEGSALMLGSSLNSITRRFGVATPLEESSSRMILKHYEEIWSGAVPVEGAPAESAPAVTGATVDDGTGA